MGLLATIMGLLGTPMAIPTSILQTTRTTQISNTVTTDKALSSLVKGAMVAKTGVADAVDGKMSK